MFTSAFQAIFSLLHDAPFGIAVYPLGADEGLLQVNHTLCEMLGYREEELLGRPIAEIGHPDDAERTARKEEQIADERERTRVQLEKRYRHRDGHYVWVLASATKLVDPETGAAYLLSQYLDIDERKRAEERLARSEVHLRTVLETSEQGFCEFDADGRITYVNPRLAEAAGYAREEMLGRRGEDFMFESDTSLAQEYERRRREVDGPLRYEFRFRHRDGRELWTHVSATLRTDETGAYAGGFAFLTDITEVRRFREELRRSAELQRALARNLPDTVAMLFDRDLRYMLVGGQSALVSGADQLVGRSLADVPDLSEAARREYEEHYRAALAGLEQQFETQYQDRVLEVTISPIRDEAGEVYAGLMVARDVSEAHESRARLIHLAENDPLTGLPNRASFRVQLDEALVEARRGSPSVLMLLDMDNFKQVNDSLGHDAGDELLRVIGERLRAAVRPGDLVARLSGDEFTVLMQGVHQAQELDLVAERILGVFTHPVKLGTHEVFPSASLGVARIPDDGDTAAAALKAADMAMYAAKREGHSEYRVFQSAMAELAQTRLRTSSELHRAVARHELFMHYQPQMSLPDEELVSVEALVRWSHPERGELLPEQFVAVAEESGLIVELGAWVMREACRQLVEWHASGIPVPRVAVNISVHQLRHPDFPAAVRRSLAESGLAPAALELELTESALMDRERAARILTDLKDTGVSIAIDDFGTGYSSLGRLRRFPIDLLKIDRSFVADADRNPDDAALVRSIVSLAHNLGIRVLAEGVERTEQRDLLIAHGCDFAAGWLWTPAMTAQEIERWMSALVQAPGA